MENHRWKELNGNNNQYFSEYEDVFLDRCSPNREHSPPISSPGSIPPNASPSRVGYIEHPISKFDTLAGIAIKYGVEVSDIKKMNGLVADLQMFALKTLQIPLPGRHPPSDGSSSTGHSSSDHNTPERAQCESFDLLRPAITKPPQRKVSRSASLHGFYRLKPMDENTICEGLALYEKGNSNSSEDRSVSRPLSRHRKSRSLVDVILSEIEERSDTVPDDKAGEVDSDKWSEKLVRRRQKSEVDFAKPELLLREDNNSSGGFPLRTGKGLALRQKSASRMSTDSEAGGLSPVPVGSEDIGPPESRRRVKKSSSMSCLQDEGNIRSTSIWSLKPDLQAFSTAAIAKPIFDGLPKPIPGRKVKAALDKHI